MTAEEWALAASSFFAGLAAGFLGGLCTIIRPMQAAMTGPEFRTFMERFLRYADNGLGKVFNYAWSGGTTIAAIVALVLLFDDPGSTSFVLTAIGRSPVRVFSCSRKMTGLIAAASASGMTSRSTLFIVRPATYEAGTS